MLLVFRFYDHFCRSQFYFCWVFYDVALRGEGPLSGGGYSVWKMLPAPATCLSGYRARKELPLVRIRTPFPRSCLNPFRSRNCSETLLFLRHRVQTRKHDGSHKNAVLAGYFYYYFRLFKVLWHFQVYSCWLSDEVLPCSNDSKLRDVYTMIKPVFLFQIGMKSGSGSDSNPISLQRCTRKHWNIFKKGTERDQNLEYRRLHCDDFLRFYLPFRL